MAATMRPGPASLRKLTDGGAFSVVMMDAVFFVGDDLVLAFRDLLLPRLQRVGLPNAVAAQRESGEELLQVRGMALWARGFRMLREHDRFKFVAALFATVFKYRHDSSQSAGVDLGAM